MYIKRTINGMKFNIMLLPGEVLEAYFEQQEKFDIEDVISYIELGDSDSCWGSDYQIFMDHKEEIAELMRQYINSGMSMPDARELAAREVINKQDTASFV